LKPPNEPFEASKQQEKSIDMKSYYKSELAERAVYPGELFREFGFTELTFRSEMKRKLRFSFAFLPLFS